MAVWLTMSLSQGTPNETARTNTVTATVTVHYSGGSYNGNSPSGTVTIDGQSSSFTCNFNYAGIGQGAVTTGTGSVVAATRTVTVSYGSSTTKTVSASASFNSGTASGTVSTSGSINLTPISAGGSSGGGDDGDDDNTEEWDPDNPGGGSGGGNSGGDSGETEYPYQYTLNYILSEHCRVECYAYGVLLDTVLSSKSRSYKSTTSTVYTFVFIAEEGYKLDGCFINNVACDGSGTLTASNGEYTIIVFASLDDSGGGDSGGEDSGGGDDVVTPSVRGVFYIDNGSAFDEYECFLDNGTDWVPIGASVSNSVNTGSASGEFTLSEDNVTTYDIEHSMGVTPDFFYLYMDDRDTVVGSDFSSYLIENMISRRNNVSSTGSSFTELSVVLQGSSNGSVTTSFSRASGAMSSTRIRLYLGSNYALKSGVKYRWFACKF